MKILCEYVKSLSPYVKGDIRSMEYDEFIDLRDRGFVKDRNILCKEYQETYCRQELTGKNILGQKYKYGVDIVVLTKKKSNVKTVFNTDDYGIINYTILESNFVKTGIGFAGHCNIGAKMYENLGEYILFLNDDVIIPDKEQFIKDLLEPFKDLDVGMVGTECSNKSFGINGSVMCIRRELFEMIGGFDDNFFFMWEDNDMNKQIEKRGFKIVVSKAKAEHKGKDSMNTESPFWKKYFFEGREKYNKKYQDKRIIGSMIVGDENDRYLKEVIKNLFERDLIDKMVIILDKSNKATISEINELKQVYNIRSYYHNFKLFGKAENILRERAIQYTMSENPYAIIPIDADEILDEELTRDKIYELLEENICWDFPIAHCWKNKDTIRIDGIFGHQQNVRLFKVVWEENTKFFNKNLHCGSVPLYAYAKRRTCNYLFKHYGYIKKEDIEAKHKRQIKYDKHKLLEDPSLYEKMMEDKAETIPYNKDKFMKIWKS